uniref:PGG domain-containing protein n=1 Tax=Setaria italica TaxID=4555 RepID=K3ZM88_SETIT
MNPELLVAACHGCHTKLTSLLNSEDQDTAIVVEIDRGTSTAAASSPASSSPSLLLQGVTSDGDSALHVVAAAGDGDGYLRSAEVIHGKARHLLEARNKGWKTPLHCAARAGNVEMLTLLIRLAGEERVRALLRTENGVGETALHEAIRAGDVRAVDVLMTADPCLARVPDGGAGSSPLYLAVALRRYAIARDLHKRDSQLSCSGPGGQNALHAAVLRSEEMTKLLLEWNKQLTKQQDEHGNTPLHFALSLESVTRGMLPLYAVPVKKGKAIATLLNISEQPLELTRQLLEADAYSAFQPDREGSFPIHIAASAGRLSAVKVLVTMFPGCAGLCDSDGRTFVHVAVKKKRYSIVAYACQTPALSTILNKHDIEGNTALHLAVEVGDWMIFARLFVNNKVDFNLPNNKKHTPLEFSINTIPTGLYCLLNSRILIQETLIAANATRGISRRDADMEEYSPQSEAENEEKGSAIVSNSTQFLSVGLVLITTMAFGATFALPGGYIADDHTNGGTPTLARVKQFQGFMMANTLAFFCSSLAVLSLVFAGTPTVELPMRYMHYNISIWLSLNAVGSLAIAFAIAVYIMITPVAAKTSLAVIVVILSIGILHSPSITEKFTVLLLVLCIRPGILPVLRSSISKVMLLMCWPLIVIFGWQELSSRYQ